MRKTNLSEQQRLELIVQAILYCQKVTNLGMPKSVLSKTLREPIFYLWDLRKGNKREAAEYISGAALKLSKNEIFGKNNKCIYDHSIPFTYVQQELMKLVHVDHNAVKQILFNYSHRCIITKEEDNRLKKQGLIKSMPEGCESDPLSRYTAAKIEVFNNPYYIS